MYVTNSVTEKFTPIGHKQRFLVKEKRQNYTDHDRLFKQLIKTFFREFLEAFFPELHEQIDFNKITFLSEEKHTHDGNKRILDLVVEVKWKETDTAIVVHIEPQSSVQTDFHVRMFKYYGILYNKLNKPIIPIAIFSYEEDWEESAFRISFSDIDVLRFEYLTLHLRKKNWREFMKQNNPVSAALLSKMGYSENEKVQVKLEFIKILTRLKLDREKTDLLFGFFETYLKLNEKEEEKFVAEARKLENAEEVFELTISYKEEGRKEGRKEEKTEIALELLRKGLDKKLIMEVTKLEMDEIEKLEKRL